METETKSEKAQIRWTVDKAAITRSIHYTPSTRTMRVKSLGESYTYRLEGGEDWRDHQQRLATALAGKIVGQTREIITTVLSTALRRAPKK